MPISPMRRLDAIGQDARSALRALRAGPATTVVVVLTLAISFAAVATMYGLMSRLLLQPPPHVVEPDRVARLFFHYDAPGSPRVTSSEWYACVRDRLRAEAVTVQHAAAYDTFQVSVGAGADAASVRAALVSAGFWATLGTAPATGRLFADAEASPDSGTRVAILGYTLWRLRYGGDPGVIGGTLLIRGEPFQIIGVTPRGFRGIELDDVDVWLPLSAYALTGRSWQTDSELRHVVRLRPGVTAAQADADLSRSLSDVVDEDLGCDRSAASTPPVARLSATTSPLIAGLGEDMQPNAEARLAVWLVALAVVLLGVACANVAGLLLMRALRRRREIAVRLALGMSRHRFAAQLFMESAMLTLLGGLAAVAVVLWGGTWINRMLLPNALWDPRDIVDRSMLVLTAACLTGTTFLAGLAPLLQVPADPLPILPGAALPSRGRGRRVQRGLLVAQVALSVVLLTGAGLFIRSLRNVQSLEFGLDVDNVLVATVDFIGTGRPARDVAAFYERALERVHALPGVARASLATSIPLRSARAKSIRPLNRGEPLTGPGGDATYGNTVTPGFFATTGTRLVEGRDFLPHERSGAPVVVLNEATARAGWPDRSPVGECVEIDDRAPCATIVGVVENARRFFLREPPALLFYEPLAREGEDLVRGGLFVRVATEARDVGAAVTRALQALEADLPFVRIQTFGDALGPQIRPWRLGAAVFTLFGVTAALLAAMGLYGALAYAVSQRTHEIGVRIAIGAGARNIVSLVARDGLGITLAGLLVGVVISLAGGRWIAGLLFDVSPRDPAVFAAVGLLLLHAAVLAAAIPSRRATRVDPAVTLRID